MTVLDVKSILQVLKLAMGKQHDSKEKPQRGTTSGAGNADRYMRVQRVKMIDLYIVWTVDVSRHERRQVLKVCMQSA